MSGLCRDGNRVSSKPGAHVVLRSILGLKIDPNSVPAQSEGRDAYLTIIEPPYVPPLKGIQVKVEKE